MIDKRFNFGGGGLCRDPATYKWWLDDEGKKEDSLLDEVARRFHREPNKEIKEDVNKTKKNN